MRYNSRMEAPFELTAPGPALADMQKGDELLQRITQLGMRRRVNRPTLVAWSFRIEKSLHAKLQKAGEKIDPLGMSDIVNGLLEVFLPVLLAQKAGVAENLVNDPARFAQFAQQVETIYEMLHPEAGRIQ
jgi:hypothetical protein